MALEYIEVLITSTYKKHHHRHLEAYRVRCSANLGVI
jgi:hypothetical protein